MPGEIATTEDWLERARGLAPVIEKWRDQGEQERRLPRPIFEAMQEAGLFKMWLPRLYGGAEVASETSVKVVETISRFDGAAGWNLFIGGTGGLFAVLLPDAAAREVFGNADTIVAGGFAPGGQAIPVAGGYKVSGRWPFASGCQHANWLVGGCLIMENGQ